MKSLDTLHIVKLKIVSTTKNKLKANNALNKQIFYFPDGKKDSRIIYSWLVQMLKILTG